MKKPREKGRRLELEIAKSLRDSGLDPDASRMPLSGGVDGFKSDIRTTLPIHIEAKNQETWEPLKFYEQAERGANQGMLPIVVMGKNRVEPFALLKWKDLIYLMQLAKQGGFFVKEYGYSKRKQVGK